MNRETQQDTQTEHIQQYFFESPIGVLEIRYSDSLIHALLFCRDEQLSSTSIEKRPPVLKQCVKQLQEYFSGSRKIFDFPFSQDGTSFQKKVWDELCRIPYGRTVSYLELSKRIGDTKAIRAVGTANGRNNLAIIVPCHRVIGSNGNLIGYGGELWRKKWLLEHENKYANGVQVLFSDVVKDTSHKS